MALKIDVHAKVLPRTADGPLFHSLEARIAALADRFAALERRPAKGASVAPAKQAAAPVEPAANPQWAACAQDTPEVARLRVLSKELRLYSAQFAWVPSDYYNQKLEWRKGVLAAPSVNHLCKAIVLENTHCVNSDCADPRNSRYYVAVFQYVKRFDAEKVMRFVKGMNEAIGKKKFNFRLAADGQAVTGFEHNSVVPFGLATPMPIILSSDIAALQPAHFWMGGGHVDCKLRLDTAEFIKVFNPFVADITVPYAEEELATL